MNKKFNAQAIHESWIPRIQKTTGVKDRSKLEWMSEMAQVHALNESAPGLVGNVGSPYSNLMNTQGVGNPVPAQRAGYSSGDYFSKTTDGSGDKWISTLPIALKVAAKTIGLELVNTVPQQGPTGVIPYMDYVYTGGKAPYGATPSYNDATANPLDAQGNSFKTFGVPNAFKVSGSVATVAEDDGEYTVTVNDAATKAFYLAAQENRIRKVKVSLGEDTDVLDVSFIGLSRIDGQIMLKVEDANVSLATIFGGAPVVAAFTEDKVAGGTESHTVVIEAPKLISLLEDHIQGYVGAGEHDSDPWSGTYQDGTSLYEPMSRATGETSYPRALSLQVFTKNIAIGTIQVSVAVTQDQITDLQKQWGIDVVKMVENAAINELSQSINKHIMSRLFSLGWKNHIDANKVEGINLNLNLDGGNVTTTPAYAYPVSGDAGDKGDNDPQVKTASMTMPALYMPSGAAFENQDTMLKRIQNNVLAASNYVMHRGRRGPATFIVTNTKVATALQLSAQYSFSPIANNISQNAGQLYPAGKFAGMDVYVDPLMSVQDTRVLVGRKGGTDEPGVIFCPYLMAESIKFIAEGTYSPKVIVRSRYTLANVGFFPHLSYFTFRINMQTML